MTQAWQRQLSELPAEEVPNCILCGTRGSVDRRWCKYLQLLPPFSVMRCVPCRLRWLSPRPDAEGYQRLYSQAHYFGGEGASPANYAGLVKQRIGYFQARIRSLVEAADAKPPLKILDYGAATGDFVRAARDEGHQCMGIEISDDARATARAVNKVDLLPIHAVQDVGETQFDVVHMNHVLEHMPDPLAHLRWCHRILRPGGLLVLEVPQQFDNDLDRLRRGLFMGGRRRNFDAYSLHHTYFFSPHSMRMLLQLTGFEMLRLVTFDPASAPLKPLTTKNLILRIILGAADHLHNGGNVIEVLSRKSQ